MNCLAVWPRFPDSYWSFRAAFVGTPYRAAIAPLPLLTLAGATPSSWRWKLVDENVTRKLVARDLAGVDKVFVSGMLVQQASIRRILRLARQAGVPAVLGGPCVTQEPGLFPEATDLVLGEIEGLPEGFWEGLAAPAGAQRTWRAAPMPDVGRAAVPRFDLVARGRYKAHSVQWSRGCPFNCEFCDIIEIYGRKPRTKSPEQMLGELEALRRTGYRGDVFFVDDNFVGNAAAALRFLEALARWQREEGGPFRFYTEASLNLAAKPELMRALVEAGFDNVFCGIETPDAQILKATQKRQNTLDDPTASVHAIQQAGLAVKGGFIVGFDGEDETIFERQRSFIQEAAVPLAMVGLLTALPGTQLTRRLAREGRLLGPADGGNGGGGDQFDVPNFRTTMPWRPLLEGYGKLLRSLYSPEAYFHRVVAQLERLGPSSWSETTPTWAPRIVARVVVDLCRSFQTARPFLSSLVRLVRRPHLLPSFISFAAQFRHFFRYTRETVLPRLERALAALPEDAGATSAPQVP